LLSRFTPIRIYTVISNCPANHEGSSVESGREAELSPPTPADSPENLEQELARIYHQEAGGLLRYALALTQDRSQSQDAVQEVFLRYFVARSEGQCFANAKAWIYRVLRNHVIDVMRAGQRGPEVDIEGVRESPDASQDLEAHYRRLEISRQLATSLAPRELECVRLRAEGLRYEEIADVLAVRSGTVGAMLARAHKKIRKCLKQAGYADQTNQGLASEPERIPYAP
jgi:RNA polymerase sigma-70 factor (ECF subfamily)